MFTMFNLDNLNRVHSFNLNRIAMLSQQLCYHDLVVYNRDRSDKITYIPVNA